MINNSAYVAPFFPSHLQYFSTKLCTYISKRYGYLKLVKNVSKIIDPNKPFDGSYLVIVREKNTQNQHYWSFLIKDSFINLIRQ